MTKRGLTLEERFWPKVNKTEACWEWTGSIKDTWYGQIKSDGKPALSHRVSYELANGPIAAGLDIDHICRNRSCVNPGHLRAVTHKQNLENRDGAQVNNHSSGIRGVSLDSKTGKWVVKVGHKGKQRYYGSFDDLAEASALATAVRNELHTHNDADRRDS